MSKYQSYFDLLKTTLEQLDSLAMQQLEDALIETLYNGRYIYIFGNGGSGATASHIAGDFVKGASMGLEKKFRFMCLNDNAASMMAIANDISYEHIFVEPLRNFLHEGDLVIGISGSGNSANVVHALAFAKERNAKTVAMCGYKGGKIKDMADIVIHAPVMDMEVTEDVHMIVFHNIKQQIITRLQGNASVSMGSVYDQRVK